MQSIHNLFRFKNRNALPPSKVEPLPRFLEPCDTLEYRLYKETSMEPESGQNTKSDEPHHVGVLAFGQCTYVSYTSGNSMMGFSICNTILSTSVENTLFNIVCVFEDIFSKKKSKTR